MSECIFCKIAHDEMDAQIVREDDRAIAFRDINPQAPTHILIIPRRHVSSLSKAEEKDRDLLGHLLLMARDIAQEEHLEAGYRVVLNSGAGAGQSVFHIHLHVLGGRTLNWPPG